MDEKPKKKDLTNDLTAKIVKSQYSEEYAKRILSNLKELVCVRYLLLFHEHDCYAVPVDSNTRPLCATGVSRIRSTSIVRSPCQSERLASLCRRASIRWRKKRISRSFSSAAALQSFFLAG